MITPDVKKFFDRNPFNYNPYCRFFSFNHFAETDDQFSDRRKIRKDILSRILNGHLNVVLYGPRRYGKSTLVAELFADLSHARVPYMMFDVVKAPSIDLFVSSYARKVHEHLAPSQFKFSQIGTFLKILKMPMFADRMRGPKVFYMASDKPISPEALAEILDLPQKLLSVSGEDRAVIVFDEFQEMTNLLPDDSFERVMRTVLQSHTNVSYIFLGSRYRIVHMFTDPSRPLYKSAEPILLKKPPVEESVRFVIDRFASAHKIITMKDAERLVEWSGNIPCFIQQLGGETFRLVNDARKKYVSDYDISTAFLNLVRFNRNHYEQLMFMLSSSQRKLLIALSLEPTSGFDAAYRRRHALGASSTAYSAKTKLMENGLIEFSDGYYGVFDPFFDRFLRQE